MQIPPDDVEDLQELTVDISKYIFEKLEDCDLKHKEEALLSITLTLLVNLYDHPQKAFEFVEKLLYLIENLSDTGENDETENG